MEVKKLLRREPIVVELGTSLRQAAQIMVREGVGLLPIVSPGDRRRVLGVISERDFVKAFATQRGLDDLNVEDVGTMGDVVAIREDASVGEAARLMLERGIRHLVVVDTEGKLVGVISIRDVVKIDEMLRLASQV
ncbi:CBS domain-containing protein [Infirmifilum sp. NZ]|uniref:CBS domain-containing protein n=1 Tax=Infirmifilum sp. NZ TaxID=2926850 RepID=UPI00279B0C3A|nr:CBS domain-containing protein [Infirmifilum sp. NZ]UNQ73622.1 CBS domain-containing protein [Infirmifilum sp. NZ]